MAGTVNQVRAFNSRKDGVHPELNEPPVVAEFQTTGEDGRVLVALAQDEMEVLRAYWDRRAMGRTTFGRGHS